LPSGKLRRGRVFAVYYSGGVIRRTCTALVGAESTVPGALTDMALGDASPYRVVRECATRTIIGGERPVFGVADRRGSRSLRFTIRGRARSAHRTDSFRGVRASGGCRCCEAGSPVQPMSGPVARLAAGLLPVGALLADAPSLALAIAAVAFAVLAAALRLAGRRVREVRTQAIAPMWPAAITPAAVEAAFHETPEGILGTLNPTLIDDCSAPVAEGVARLDSRPTADGAASAAAE
jgi:hypothetical protein